MKPLTKVFLLCFLCLLLFIHIFYIDGRQMIAGNEEGTIEHEETEVTEILSPFLCLLLFIPFLHRD
jgi:hypothetical protein